MATVFYLLSLAPTSTFPQGLFRVGSLLQAPRLQCPTHLNLVNCKRLGGTQIGSTGHIMVMFFTQILRLFCSNLAVLYGMVYNRTNF